YYQRLVARDEHGANRTASAYLETHDREELFDDVLLPALSWAKRDHEADVLTDEDKRFVLDATHRIATGMAGDRTPDEDGANASAPARARILGCPARDKADEAGLRLLALLLPPARCEMRTTSSRLLISETLDLVERERPDLVCVGSLPPGRFPPTLHLVKRLRSRFPDLPVVVGRLGAGRNIEEWEDRLQASGVDHVSGTLAAMRAQILELLSTTAVRG